MRIATIIFLISILTATNVNSQEGKIQLHDIKTSEEIENELESGEIRSSSAAYYYTYIGETEKALETYEIPVEWGLDTMSENEREWFSEYEPVNAQEYLSQRVEKEQIVIISEAHHKPQHRVFTADMLDVFYEKGYRYLGLETLTPNFVDPSKYLMDTMINKRGYALNSPLSGFYTREPQMGNMVRKAISLGMTVFGYEYTGGELDRDLGQAKKIAEYMADHPEGKILIHCGWYHAIESNYPKYEGANYMAYHLKQITGIDPLTIYQDVLSEKRELEESPYYRELDAVEVSVLVDDKGDVFNGKIGTDHFDILVYHPETSYKKNRPDWLYKESLKEVYEAYKGREEDYPIIVEAYKLEEENGVPVDRVEYMEITEKKPLLLELGKYRIRILDKHLSPLKEYELKVE